MAIYTIIGIMTNTLPTWTASLLSLKNDEIARQKKIRDRPNGIIAANIAIE